MIRIGGLHRSREGSGSAREERNGFALSQFRTFPVAASHRSNGALLVIPLAL